MTTLISEYGKHDQKGTVLGIFRSIGALARAVGPIFASIGNFFFLWILCVSFVIHAILT